MWDNNSPWATHASLQRVDICQSTEKVSEWREQWGKPVIIDEPYFGSSQPAFRTIAIPPGNTAPIDLIDTWNMTIDRLDQTFTGTSKVNLPGRPFIALRVILS
jgi:hypothetical protein